MRVRRPLGIVVLAAAALLGGACDDIIGANDATIVVENYASISVREIYIADCGASDWGSDELGPTETIPPGHDREFGVAAGCHDLRAVFLDSSEAVDRNIDLDEGDQFNWELTD